MYMYIVYVHVHTCIPSSPPTGAEWSAGADHRERAEEQDQGEMFEEEDEWKEYMSVRYKEEREEEDEWEGVHV